MTEKEMKVEITQAHIDGYNRGYAKAKDKIADIKANCDLAIEGRDIKINELENKYNKLESDFRICEKNADTYYDQLSKAKELIEDMYGKIPSSHSDYYKDVMERATQFLKEIEK